MSHNRPDWLSDDGEFKESFVIAHFQSNSQVNKKPNYDEANEAALKLVILLLVGFIVSLMLCGLMTSAMPTKSSEICNMTEAEFYNAVQYPRSAAERSEITEYYYTYCRSD